MIALTVVMLLTAVYLLSSTFFPSSTSSSAAVSSASPAASSSSSSAASYSGRPLVDPVLQKRWGLAVDADPEWTVEEVARHSRASDLWLIIDGAVFDVTDFVEEHPGGLEALMKRPGQDNSEGFNGPQHPEKVHQLIGEFYVGRLKKADGHSGAADTVRAGGGEAALVGASEGGTGSGSGSSGAEKRRRSRKE